MAVRRYVFSRANEPDDGSGLGGPVGTSGWSPMDVQQSKDDLFEWDDANVEATVRTTPPQLALRSGAQ